MGRAARLKGCGCQLLILDWWAPRAFDCALHSCMQAGRELTSMMGWDLMSSCVMGCSRAMKVRSPFLQALEAATRGRLHYWRHVS